MIKIEPQPKKGKPFRINFTNRGLEYWYNERLGYPDHGPMLIEWRCPYGDKGKPEKINGIWYWIKKSPNQCKPTC